MAAEDTFQKRINDYLYFGYLPPSEFPDFLSKLEGAELSEYSLKSTISLLEEVFEDALELSDGSGYCIIPVSGGWDSRILLGLALERFSANQIKTYTFGTPGQLDFEIGAKVSKEAGVEHRKIDLNNVELSWKKLLHSVEESPWTYVPDSFFNKYCYRKMAGEKDIILSGFMGDPLTGGHLHEKDDEQAIQNFLKEQVMVRSMKLTSEDYNPKASLPDVPKQKELTFHEMLDFGVRQAHCIAPIISSEKAWRSWGTELGRIKGSNSKVITPFTHPKWATYWIHAPAELKKQRKMYLNVLNEKFPKLAKLPSKNFYGAKQADGISAYMRKKVYHGQILLNKKMPHVFRMPNHLINYLDYGTAFRRRDDYREILLTAFNFLNENRLTPWLNLQKFLKEHDEYKADYSKVFLLLIGLVLNLNRTQNR